MHPEGSHAHAFCGLLQDTAWHAAAVVDLGFHKHAASHVPDLQRLMDARGVAAEVCGGRTILVGGKQIAPEHPAMPMVLHHSDGRIQPLSGLLPTAAMEGHTLTAIDDRFLLLVGGSNHSAVHSLVDTQPNTVRALPVKAASHPSPTAHPGSLPALEGHTTVLISPSPGKKRKERFVMAGGTFIDSKLPNHTIFLLHLHSPDNRPTISFEALHQVGSKHDLAHTDPPTSSTAVADMY